MEIARTFFFSGLPRVPSEKNTGDFHKRSHWRAAIQEYNALLLLHPAFTIYHVLDWVRSFSKGDQRLSAAYKWHPASEWLQFPGGDGEYAAGYTEGLAVQRFIGLPSFEHKIAVLRFELDLERRKWKDAGGAEVTEWESDRAMYALIHAFFLHRPGALAADVLKEVRGATHNGTNTIQNGMWGRLVDKIEKGLHTL